MRWLYCGDCGYYRGRVGDKLLCGNSELMTFDGGILYDNDLYGDCSCINKNHDCVGFTRRFN